MPIVPEYDFTGLTTLGADLDLDTVPMETDFDDQAVWANWCAGNIVEYGDPVNNSWGSWVAWCQEPNMSLRNSQWDGTTLITRLENTFSEAALDWSAIRPFYTTFSQGSYVIPPLPPEDLGWYQDDQGDYYKFIGDVCYSYDQSVCSVQSVQHYVSNHYNSYRDYQVTGLEIFVLSIVVTLSYLIARKFGFHP